MNNNTFLSISAPPAIAQPATAAEADQASNTAPPAPPAIAQPATPARSRRRGKSLTLTILMRNCVLI